MKKVVLKIILTLCGLYIGLCVLLYFFQEKLIFFPEKLAPNYEFNFNGKFEEMLIKASDNTSLHGILFRSNNSKGLIFYLHGNAGSLNSWGEIAKTYTDLSYDLFIMDYRGYGKSEGSIGSESQLFQDIQIVYQEMRKIYPENKIVIIGYSIGTGIAAKTASVNHPKLLILQAPYYSLTDMMKHHYPIIPTFLLKYKFETNKFIRDCKMPIVIFHGDQDEVIYYNSSVKLKQIMKPNDVLITLKGQHHNGMTDNPEYKENLRRILAE